MPIGVVIIPVVILTVGVYIVCKKIRAKMSARRLASLRKEIDEKRPIVNEALSELSSKFNYSHYITESERIELAERYAELQADLKKIVNSKEFPLVEETEQFLRLFKALSDTKGHKEVNNNKFIDGQLAKNKEYFDTVLAYPLDDQQREAIVSLEDNVLVISSAGSGKTMTTVGKVRYLIDKQGVDPDRILLITFTRKAAASLSERLGEKKLRCLTFHKLALDIIAEETGQRPSLSEGNFATKVYHQLMDNDVDFHHAIADYVLRSRYKMQSQFDFESMEDYMQGRKEKGIQAFYTDMDGRPVFCKSDEESQICDWLGERGIQFRYEEKYEYDTLDSDYRQYKPDFSIYFTDASGRKRRVYLEHYAVNEYGHVPKWFGDGTDYSHQVAEVNYLNGIEWKRNLHNEKGTVLLETRSANFHKGDVFDVLLAQLKRNGYVETLAIHNNDNISRELVHQEESILNMLTAFTFLLKSKENGVARIDDLNIDYCDRLTINQVVRPFLLEYEREQKVAVEIDFVDAIIRATEICKNGHSHEYDYILVDEFQDISMDRYRFLQSLRTERPRTKLFCVGDDWQSIYRFAGSDMSLFKNFSKFFGYTKECRMETTYRFGEPLISESSKFILRNPDQKSKTVKPFHEDSNTRLEFVPIPDRTETVGTVISLLNTIPADQEVYILGRYSFNVNIFKNSPIELKSTSKQVTLSYNGRMIPYMTIHQSKGLECDYVILLGCDSGSMGFPTEIDDAPILKYVLSEPDGYKFGEERRLFYVGVTRAKIVTYVLYNAEKPSVFVTELTNVQPPQTKNGEETIPENLLCPRCRCGRIVEVRRGKAVNGNPYTFYVCSNEKYGCDYKETRFVNLNRGYRSRRK